MQSKQDSWNYPTKRRRFKDLEEWSSFSLGVEGELLCLLTHFEHKETRNPEGKQQRILMDLERNK